MSKISMLGEIDRNAKQEHKPVLRWFLDIATTDTMWNCMVTCNWVDHHRVYSPKEQLLRLADGLGDEYAT
jgi:hypothetical protein